MTPIGDTTEETFDVASELEQLESLTMAALKRRYRQATGHDSKTRNRQYLIRRLIWIAQAAVHGGLGEDALALAAALANDASIRASPPRARVLEMTTDEAALVVPDASVDFVFVDADHTEEAVARDIATWTPKVRPGGLIAGHDIRWPTVRRAVAASGPFEEAGHDQVWLRWIK